MSQSLTVTDFLHAPGVLLDVRSPAEYAQAHIPGAISFPLFTNEERAQVGICYKQQGRDAAVELGFAITGPKLAGLVATAKELAPDRQVRVHCWRGGMRSESVVWLLNMAGMQVSVLAGGYKAFRRWVRSTFETPHSIIILGGMTGTGKTDMLTALAAHGEQVLDLEHLANHRGSSYGALGLPPQPSNEHFENRVALEWATFDSSRPVWIEAESKRIGLCRVPDEIFAQMERSPVLEITRSRGERIALLETVYGEADPIALIAATERLRKRLGGLRTQQAVDWIRQGNLAPAIEITLDYYDKTYTYDLKRRQVPIYPVDVAGLTPRDGAGLLLDRASKLVASSAFEPLQPVSR
ncbi:tRNA 2-selenouridine(34) synthase MnmH [Oculatella sp. LEGE 06141]|uniref:tRNA 2-selenouridine(34) synthase MnmH n=1 Tax=Oculatella sp. LEGE 06141 TaxID=1828648 RepID=UPI00187E1023|nr:tRNA 2-selenouridine(34) synthase MnmH [Oculatella sp. LEGE 06141]MBE9178444.1 tRNA 2-selenouridine(34) synthase MnmH [Oculatella sp. LEGE 06141]